MAISSAPLTTSFSGSGSQLKSHQVKLTSRGQRNSIQFRNSSNFCVRAEYSDNSRGGGADFLAGVLVGGAVFGTLAIVYAPKIKKAILRIDDTGFVRPRGPIYYDEGLERREKLNAKISQLSSAIDNVASRLKGGLKVGNKVGNSVPVPRPTPIDRDCV